MHSTRRTLFRLTASAILAAPAVARRSEAAPVVADLREAPIQLAGEWGQSPPQSAEAVVARMRQVCLANVRLVSDRQPETLRVDARTDGPPQVQIHQGAPSAAWIIVDIGPRDWCKLAYQFGHELGHVLCNSWVERTRLSPPSHWLEEAMVEAFSIRGLALLADSWDRSPPLPANPQFGRFVREYREAVLRRYREAAAGEPSDLAVWFRRERAFLDHVDGLDKGEGPGVLALLAELERDRSCVEDMGAINRWPAKSGLPIEDYLHAWQQSCAEVKAPGHFPERLRQILALH